MRDSFEHSLYQQLNEIYLPLIMSQPYYKPQDIAKELNSLKLNDLDKFRESMFRNFRFTSLFVGNVLKEEAFEFIKEMKVWYF